jgi:hypothetical protein
MANEITVNVTLQVAKGALAAESLGLSAKFTFAGVNIIKKTMSIPTTAGGTVLDVSGLSGLGMGVYKNLDSTNYLDLMTGTTGASGVAFARLLALECAYFRWTAAITAPAALANTAAVELEYMILEP